MSYTVTIARNNAPAEDEAGFAVFDYQTKTIHRPREAVDSTGAARPKGGKSFLSRLFGG